MLTADQTTNCARILFATTESWQPSDGTASTLADARTMLAQLIYAVDGKSFAQPATDEAVKQPAAQNTWKACVAAAQAATDPSGEALDPFGLYAVFWIADPANAARPGDGLGLSWPYQPDSHLVRVSGPILDGKDPRPKRLFFFNSINQTAAIEADADAGPGFWPRRTSDGAGTTASPPAQTALAPVNVASRPGLATGLFVLWLVTGFLLSIWLWQLGDTVRATVTQFGQTSTDCIPTPPKDKATAADQVKPTWAAACTQKWAETWSKQISDDTAQQGDSNADAKNWQAKIADKLTSIRKMIARQLWSLDRNGQLSLLLPYVLIMGSVVLLLMAAGLARKGFWFGVLIDDRNRMSMSRAQQVAWTTLLIPALCIMGWFNTAAISLIDQAAQSDWDLFPSMPGPLWAALGINLVATPFLSDAILNRKDPKRAAPSPGAATDSNPPAPASNVVVRQLVTPARLDNNGSPTDASWVDLITGETKGTDQELDISRIQHLVISGVLLTSYFMLIASAISNISGASIASAIQANVAVFTSMPGVGTTTFLGLLGISHAGYLVFKATSPEGSGQPSSDPKK